MDDEVPAGDGEVEGEGFGVDEAEAVGREGVGEEVVCFFFFCGGLDRGFVDVEEGRDGKPSSGAWISSPRECKRVFSVIVETDAAWQDQMGRGDRLVVCAVCRTVGMRRQMYKTS